MEISNEKVSEYSKRLILSRMRILSKNGFFGLLLMHANFAIEEVGTAATDGNKIYFDPKFLDSLSESELDFVLMHEILHIALKHCERRGNRNNTLFNIATDIVVNSNILHSTGGYETAKSLDGKVGFMHLTPNDKEGYFYTAEEVYNMLIKKNIKEADIFIWDNHNKWGFVDEIRSEEWERIVINSAENYSGQKGRNGPGLPLFAERLLDELKNAKLDWRTMLNNFIQEDINDYSFSPPDRRFDEFDFFLPDFNEKEDTVKNILFMIDTSGSMTEEMITDCFSEIKGAIEQFNGRLRGFLGFFDAVVTEPKPFENFDELKIIKPIGGGGTDIKSVFKYVKDKMTDNIPSSIVILTDGYAPMPSEDASMGIPVLWVINNEEITPEWGQVVRI